MTSSDHLLLLSVDVATGIEKRRKVSKTPIKYGAPAPDDSYAPAPAGCACVDETGRMRIMHSYVVSARDGMRCLWCNKLEPVKAAASYRGKKS